MFAIHPAAAPELGCPIFSPFFWGEDGPQWTKPKQRDRRHDAVTVQLEPCLYGFFMPWGLERYQNTGDLHFITFSCYQRLPFLPTPASRRVFEETLERVRRWYRLFVTGYVVMPEHVHLLISEPERSSLRVAIQMLKQITAQKLRPILSPKEGEKDGAPGIQISLSRNPPAGE